MLTHKINKDARDAQSSDASTWGAVALEIGGALLPSCIPGYKDV